MKGKLKSREKILQVRCHLGKNMKRRLRKGWENLQKNRKKEEKLRNIVDKRVK
jgi:hypothetical protein